MKDLSLFLAFCCCLAQAQDSPIVLDPNKYIVKSISYDYDLVSGKVNEVSYQGGEADQLLHRYEYDGDNRLTACIRAATGWTGHVMPNMSTMHTALWPRRCWVPSRSTAAHMPIRFRAG